PISGKTAVFEYVCANMTIDIIRPILELLLTKTSKRLLLSGILREQQVTITGDLERLGFVPSRIEDDGEWVAILVEK
ncbi:MAG: hypothetical protein HKN33_16370, partial [Pyrinomonadaceae bacterium]|nr:hypothetical protein [Pyrinomonadaceae bacterium]